ncbi:hypothetical protein Areg01_78690 [Actinoplanes regularis]|nr:hypothetical protein Areg01_78690 [Actinoplanes regularis]
MSGFPVRAAHPPETQTAASPATITVGAINARFATRDGSSFGGNMWSPAFGSPACPVPDQIASGKWATQARAGR